MPSEWPISKQFLVDWDQMHQKAIAWGELMVEVTLHISLEEINIFQTFTNEQLSLVNCFHFWIITNIYLFEK